MLSCAADVGEPNHVFVRTGEHRKVNMRSCEDALLSEAHGARRGRLAYCRILPLARFVIEAVNAVAFAAAAVPAS